MPTALVARYSRYRLGFEHSVSDSRSNPSGQATENSGRATTYWTPASNLKYPGLSVEREVEKAVADTVGSGEVRFAIPDLAEFHTEAIGHGNGEAFIEVENLRVYKVDDYTWRVDWDEINFIVDGGVVHTIAGSTFYGIPGYLTPSAVPLIGIPPELAAGASVSPPLAFGQPSGSTTVASLSASAATTVVGGWRVERYETGTFVNLPATITTKTIGGASCPCAEAVPIPSGTTTHSFTISAKADESIATTKTRYVCDQCSNGPASTPHIADVYRTRKTIIRSSCTIDMACAHLTKAIRRLNPDYRALWRRGGIPKALLQTAWSCQSDPEGSATSNVEQHEIFPRYTSFLEHVANGTSQFIEQPLAIPNYVPYSAASLKEDASTYTLDVVQPGSCPLVDPEEPPGEIVVCYTVPGDSYCLSSRSTVYPLLETKAQNAFLLDYLVHNDRMATYNNYNANPHWSYDLYFPANTIDTDGDSVPDAQNIWQVDGAPIDVRYFTDVRSQSIDHPSLPAAARKKSRNHVVTEPLRDGSLAPFLENYISGAPNSFIGVSRFDIQDAVLEDLTFSATSSPAWTGTDCGLAFGSSVTVTPTDTNPVIEIDLGRWDAPPYQKALLFEKLRVGWSGGDIDEARCFLVSQSGETALVTKVPGTFNRPDGDDLKYVGSWAQDFGVGKISDTGLDLLGSGESASTLGNVETAQAYELLKGFTSAKIRFEFDLSGLTAFTLDYPRLTMPQGLAKVLHESGQFTSLYWPNSPLVRFGQRYWWTGSLNTTPALAITGEYPMTALDWLCEKRVTFQGIERSSTLLSEISTLWDANEGQTYQRADDGTKAVFWTPTGDPASDVGNLVARVLLIDSAAELPPMSNLPFPARDTGTLAIQASNSEQVAYTLCVGPSRLISSRLACHLEHPTTRDRWTAADPDYTINGWVATKHERSLTNSEAGFRILREDGALGDHAALRPWRGFAMVTAGEAEEPDAADDLANAHDRLGRYHTAEIRDGDVWFRRSDAPGIVPRGFALTMQVTSDGDCRGPTIALVDTLRSVLAYVREDLGSFYRRTDDDGETWSDPEMAIADALLIRSASHEAGYLALCGAVGEEAPLSLRLRVQGPGDQDFGAELPIVDDSNNPITVEAVGLSISIAKDGAMPMLLFCRVFGEPSPSHWVSTDWDDPDATNVSFKRVT